MGRRNKACHKDLHQQAYESLTSIQAGEPACRGADAGRHQAARNAPGCPFIPGGLLYPCPQRKGWQGAPKPYHRAKCGADHRADQ